MKKTICVALFGLVLVTNQSFAASIDERQQNQKERIKQGVASGELTKREVNRLSNQHFKIAKKEAIYKSDGKFTKEERLDLQTDLNKNSRKIFGQKHDGQATN